MLEITVIQTYNIGINQEIYVFAKNFALNNNDEWFKLRLQKIYADSPSIKTLDDWFTDVLVKATVYLIVTFDSRYDLCEFCGGKVSFTIDLGKVKSLDLKGCFEVETSDNVKINFDLNFNSKFLQKDKNFFTKSIVKIIRRGGFKVNIEQTVGKIEFIRKNTLTRVRVVFTS